MGFNIGVIWGLYRDLGLGSIPHPVRGTTKTIVGMVYSVPIHLRAITVGRE